MFAGATLTNIFLHLALTDYVADGAADWRSLLWIAEIDLQLHERQMDKGG
jgi:hypothetical protein